MVEGGNTGDVEYNCGSGNSNWETREGIQVQIKSIKITIFCEGRGCERGTFCFDVCCSGSSWCYC